MERSRCFVAMNQQEQILPIELLPYRPWCADETKRMRVRPRDEALQYPYLQLNPPGIVRVVSIDVDYECGPYGWRDVWAPPPNFTVHAVKTGRVHCSDVLAVPVSTKTEKGQPKHPARWLAGISRALVRKLEADRVVPVITRNPFAPGPDARLTIHRIEPYDLDELDSWVGTRPPEFRPVLEHSGIGRNVSLFDSLRIWAYRQVRRCRAMGEERWYRYVLSEAEELNSEFRHPLQWREVRDVARSVASWTWENYEGSGRSYNRGAARRAGLIDGTEPAPVRIAAGGVYTRKLQRARSEALVKKALVEKPNAGIDEISAFTGLRIPNKTASHALCLHEQAPCP